MFKNAFRYITRKPLKSVVILLIIATMSTLSLVGLSIKTAAEKASKETFKDITNSFAMQINRRTNPGTPRGAGNLKGEDITQIAKIDGVKEHVKRMGVVADLVDHEIIAAKGEVKDAERARKFGRTLMVTGVNDSTKEDKFVAETFKLVDGRHLEKSDVATVLMHEDLAKKNNLKVGDKLKIKSNIYDADNEKQADETVEVTILGLFAGKNKTGVSSAQELYENNLIADLDTAAKLYGYTKENAIYQDATFFVDGNKNLDQVMSAAQKLAIDWKSYQLIKGSSNFPSLQKSIAGVYGVASKLLIGGLIFSGAILTLVLFLWLNARRKEIGILLSIGKNKWQIVGQFMLELIMIGVVGFGVSYYFASQTGSSIASGIVKNVTTGITKELNKEAATSKLAGGAEIDGFNKTITDLEIKIEPADLIFVVVSGSVVILASLIISSSSLMKKQPKELLFEIA
jgi:ABC transporter, permease protein